VLNKEELNLKLAEVIDFVMPENQLHGRLSPLAIFHIHKHKDVDIDEVITEFARLKSRRLAFCL